MNKLNTIEKIHFVAYAVFFIFLVSIKIDTCTIKNDIRTTKKVTKEFNGKTLTEESLKKLRDTLFSKVDTTDN